MKTTSSYLALCFLCLFGSSSQLWAKAAFLDESGMVQQAEAIAVVEIGEPTASETKSTHWTYHRKAVARVVTPIAGVLPERFELHGNENFICASCNLSKGRFIAFLKREGDLWAGVNWHFSLRPVVDGKVEWYADTEGGYTLSQQKLDPVLKRINELRATVSEKVIHEAAAAEFVAEEKPFRLSIVPENRRGERGWISMADDLKRNFHVVLTNVSGKPQKVFDAWNSWGYQAISIEFTLSDGETTTATVKPQRFTKNHPSTFMVPPGGHQVFSIKLDSEWAGRPDFGKRGQTKASIRAAYRLEQTKESKEQDVWVGEIESESIEVTINHW